LADDLYHPCSAETSRKSGTLTYPEPLGPPWPVAGHLYFFLCLILLWRLLKELACISSPFCFVPYLESPYKRNEPNLTVDHTFKHLDSRIPTITPISCSTDISRDSPKNTTNHSQPLHLQFCSHYFCPFCQLFLF